MDEIKAILQRISELERLEERQNAILDEHSRRLEALEGLPNALAAINQAIGRLESKIEGQQQSVKLLHTILWMLLGGIIAAGFELLKR